MIVNKWSLISLLLVQHLQNKHHEYFPQLRRPLAPNGLTLHPPLTTPEEEGQGLAETRTRLAVVAASPAASPLYIEPWDCEWNKCVHGQDGEVACEVGPGVGSPQAGGCRCVGPRLRGS